MKAFGIFVLCTIGWFTSYSQNWQVETRGMLSYSGFSQSIRGVYEVKGFDWMVGPKTNYSRSRTPFSSSTGLSVGMVYSLTDSSRIEANAFVNYELLPQTQAIIHEAYVGYRLHVNVSKNWIITQEIGFGGYEETSRSTIDYSLNGLSYCVSLGLSYRL